MGLAHQLRYSWGGMSIHPSPIEGEVSHNQKKRGEEKEDAGEVDEELMEDFQWHLPGGGFSPCPGLKDWGLEHEGQGGANEGGARRGP